MSDRRWLTELADPFEFGFLMSISDQGYWLDDSLDGHYFDEQLARQLVSLFRGERVVDLGCGRADYVRFFRQHGIDCQGFDGNPLTDSLSGGVASQLDLTQPSRFPEPFDWVLSLEVGEHIPAIYEATFFDNIHHNNSKGTILSWAIPGQGGRGHINERGNAYIKSRFAEWNYQNDTELESALRAASEFGWFKNSLMAFRKNS